MRSILLIILFISSSILFAGTDPDPIITRHDKPDEAYLKFAQELPVISSIVKYNTTDVAGTLIDPKWILSAAHVAETIKDGQKLILGKDSIEVEKVVIHPGWLKDGRPEDIALIKLSASAANVETVEPYRKTDEGW